MANKSVAVILSVILIVSIISMQVLAEEQPTVGQRLDSAVEDATNAYNKHGGPQVVDTVFSTIKCVYGWFCDKAKEWGIHF